MNKTLISLAAIIPNIIHSNDAARIVAPDFITSDSRKAKQGALFIAVKGAASDGSAYIQKAIDQGACAIVSEVPPPENLPAHVGYIQVQNSRAAVCAIAAAWFDQQPRYIAAVTGTDGKTSTADFFRQIAALCGHKAASIGTLGVLGSAKEYPALNTTPDSILLHEMLSELAGEGISYVSLEASSHGLDQLRLHGVKVSAAAFTNLSRDHLDYHGDMEAYFAAKLKLFTEVLQEGGAAVINADSSYYASIVAALKPRPINCISYGKAASDLTLISMKPNADGIVVKARLFGIEKHFTLPMIGSFQVYNFLAALGMAQSCGISVEDVLAHIAQIKGVPGRLEQVALHPQHHAPIYIDYAHTPAALENILKTVRPHVKGKLHVVFGCGGDRDKGKRPQMGLAAAQFADAVVVTDDNPRSENPDIIRAEVVAPLSSAQMQQVKIIGDRKEAIAFAIGSLQKEDALVIAGKGHERYQIIGNASLPFDDAAVARQVVLELGKVNYVE